MPYARSNQCPGLIQRRCALFDFYITLHFRILSFKPPIRAKHQFYCLKYCWVGIKKLRVHLHSVPNVLPMLLQPHCIVFLLSVFSVLNTSSPRSIEIRSIYGLSQSGVAALLHNRQWPARLCDGAWPEIGSFLTGPPWLLIQPVGDSEFGQKLWNQAMPTSYFKFPNIRKIWNLHMQNSSRGVPLSFYQ